MGTNLDRSRDPEVAASRRRLRAREEEFDFGTDTQGRDILAGEVAQKCKWAAGEQKLKASGCWHRGHWNRPEGAYLHR